MEGQGNSGSFILIRTFLFQSQTLSPEGTPDCPALNVCNDDGNTPLHIACKNDKPECVQAFLIAGMSPIWHIYWFITELINFDWVIRWFNLMSMSIPFLSLSLIMTFPLFYALRSRRERDWHTRQGVSDPLRPQIFQCPMRQGDRQDVPEAASHSGRTFIASVSITGAMHTAESSSQDQ